MKNSLKNRIARVHINKHIISANRKHGKTDAPISVKVGGVNHKTHEVAILDNSGKVVAKVLHRPDRALPCGAVVWIETTERNVEV